MKILNLYAGIGGNRKLWGDEHEITAVENVPHVAEVYRHFFPKDTVIEGDAHQYLLNHYEEFDFVWSSPPCPTHSKLNIPNHAKGYRQYPDMRLYQEIIFLKTWGHSDKVKWIVENVTPYYRPLIQPTSYAGRHLVWSNFDIRPLKLPGEGDTHSLTWRQLAKLKGIELPSFKASDYDKRLMVRDITDPWIGAHILRAAMRETVQEKLV